MAPRVWIAGALVAAALALAWISLGSMGQNLVYYWTPTELLAQGDAAQGATVRLGGMVKSHSWDKTNSVLAFTIHDGETEVAVRGTEMPPDMFRDNIGVVVEGQLGPDGVFVSQRLLVKHDNEYRVPEDPKEVDVEKLWKALEGGDS